MKTKIRKRNFMSGLPALQADKVHEAFEGRDSGVVELAVLRVILEDEGVGRQVAGLLQLPDGLASDSIF
jgi:hypothetical protein